MRFWRMELFLAAATRSVFVGLKFSWDPRSLQEDPSEALDPTLSTSGTDDWQ